MMAAKHIEGFQGLTVKLYQTETEFNRWYWLRDAGADADIEFVPDPALYVKAIHGTKTKNDKIDSGKVAHRLCPRVSTSTE
jgi:hypothetical protein